jgi:hypothetical protein
MEWWARHRMRSRPAALPTLRFLSYPAENILQIGERLIVPNEFHAAI